MPVEKTPRFLAKLREPLAVVPNPGLDSIDPRLASLTALVEKEKFEELATEIESLFEQGIYDIRPISYYLWVAFFEQGIGALPEVFETLSAIVTYNAEAIGPKNKHDEHVGKRVAWLFQRIDNSIDYHETRQTPEWLRWKAEVDVSTITLALTRAGTLDVQLAGSFDAIQNPFQKLTARLRALSTTFSAPVDTEPKSGDAGPSSVVVRPTERPSPMHMRADNLGRIELGASPEFFLFVQKLEAFAALARKGDFSRAAIVSDDLMHAIDKFDPRTYFPELLSEFSELMSKHIDMLSVHWDQRESVAWKMRAQFYRVDLRRFVDGAGG